MILTACKVEMAVISSSAWGVCRNVFSLRDFLILGYGVVFWKLKCTEKVKVRH